MDRVEGGEWFSTVWINEYDGDPVYLSGTETGLKIQMPYDTYLNDKDVRSLRLAILRYEKWRRGRYE